MIENLFSKILRFLTAYGSQDSAPGRKHATFTLAILGVCITLAFVMGNSIEKKFAFFLDSIDITETDDLTIGENSDICYGGMPHDFLKIKYTEGLWHWKVNDGISDTLQYFKVNGVNPNRHEIKNDANQQIIIHIPNENQKLELKLTGEQIWKEWEHFEDQQDVQVRHFAAEYVGRHQKTTQDSVNYHAYLAEMNQKQVRSFFHCEHNVRGIDHISIIILDTLTHVDGSTYKFEGTSDDIEGCKIQFYNISDYSYWEGKENRNFQVANVNYAMRTSVKATDWGAGHVMIRHTGEKGYTINFPKGLGYIGSVDSIRGKAENTSHFLTFKQLSNTFPSSEDLYLPQISTAINQDLFSIETNEANDSLYIRDNNNNRYAVTNPTTWKLPISLVPALGKITLASGKNKLYARTGYITGSFVMSYLWIPVCVTFVLLILTLYPWSPVRLTEGCREYNKVYNAAQLENYPAYLAFLLCAAFIYIICKSLIALKLSYTYPYFEKLTGIMPVSTSLTLLLFFSLAMVLNHALVRGCDNDSDRIDIKRWIAWVVVTVLFAGIYLVQFHLLDTQINSGLISSYFHNEIYDTNILNWHNNFALNDNHRTIPYILMVVEGFILTFWGMLNVSNKWLINSIAFIERKMNQGYDYLSNTWDFTIMPLLRSKFSSLDRFSKNKGWKKLTSKKWFLDLSFIPEGFMLALRVLCPWHFLVFAVLSIIGRASGNYGTAIITFIVIFGLCKALTTIQFAKGATSRQTTVVKRHVAFFGMFIITLFYIFFAILADYGYMTNYIGFLMTFLCFYFIYDRSSFALHGDQQNAKERRWLVPLIGIILLVIYFLPQFCSAVFNTDKISYDRISRRMNLYSDFENLQRTGYRYAESDAEFMVIMSHYMQQKENGDPLSNENHFLHASISTGQSPVVLNDLCVPVAFFGSYGVGRTTILFFLMLFLMIWLVIPFSFGYSTYRYDSYLTNAMQWRLLAMFMWIGTSIYLYFSYLAWLPFTGRLIPGFGVDSVGEALETAILLAFMAAVTYKKTKKETNNTLKSD